MITMSGPRSRAAFGAIAMALAIGLILVAATTGRARTISRPSPVSTPAGLAEAWVGDINRGDRMGACELQSVANVGGVACASLPETWTMKCPRMTTLKPRPKSELRSVAEQVGAVTEEGATRAFVALRGQKKGSKARGALGLELVAGTWRVTYLRQGSAIFTPAGAVWMSESWRKLWYPPTCS
jgi:hypothetical protein